MSRKKKKTEKEAEQSSPADSHVADEPVTETAGQSDRDALAVERDDLLARLQRLGADYQNYQKRVKRDIDQAREFANEDLMKSLLVVLDDMERALVAARENHPADDPLLTGMQLVHDKTIETLKRFGVDLIEAVGKPFDPDRHTAMMQQPSDEHPSQTVLGEIQKGYTLKGRTLRPAAVIVSTKPEAADQQDDENPPSQ